MSRILVFISTVSPCFASLPGLQAAEPVGVTFKKETLQRIGSRGDNWCMTWASDDSQITSMDDGDWLATGNGYHNRLYRILGAPDELERQEIDAYPRLLRSGPGCFGYGIVAVENSIYSMVSLTPRANWSGPFRGLMMLRSEDNGRTWNRVNRQGEQVELSSTDEKKYRADADRMFFFEESERKHDGVAAYPFSYCSFAQQGRAHRDAKDDDLFVYSPEGAQSNELLLARVKAKDICRRSQWEYFSGWAGGKAAWTKDLERRRPVHTFPAKNDADEYFGWYSWLPSVVWNDGLQCYMMVNGGTYAGHTLGNSAKDYFDAWMHTKSGSLGIWYSRSPTGPWENLYYTDEWTVDDADNRTYQPKLSPKWISEDGRRMTLIWSDAMKNSEGRSHSIHYRWNQMQIELEVADPNR